MATVSDFYQLEICDTKEPDVPLITMYSDTPYQAISKGDILLTHCWEGVQLPTKYLGVIGVQHEIKTTVENKISTARHHLLMVITIGINEDD